MTMAGTLRSCITSVLNNSICLHNSSTNYIFLDQYDKELSMCGFMFKANHWSNCYQFIVMSEFYSISDVYFLLVKHSKWIDMVIWLVSSYTVWRYTIYFFRKLIIFSYQWGPFNPPPHFSPFNLIQAKHHICILCLFPALTS